MSAAPLRPPALLEEEIAIVEAIRRAYGSAAGYGGLEAFHVADIFDFARRLIVGKDLPHTPSDQSRAISDRSP